MPQRAARVPDFLYGTAWKEERTPALVELALRTGFRASTRESAAALLRGGVGQALAAAYRAALVTRADLFLQTKFTYEAARPPAALRSGGQPFHAGRAVDGQLARAPGNRSRRLLRAARPASGAGWTEHDAEVWAAMVKERDGGRTRLLGVSNVSLRHLHQMAATAPSSAFVQNRCFARLGWDRDVRPSAASAGSLPGLLAAHANLEVLRHRQVPRSLRDSGDAGAGRVPFALRWHAAADRDLRRRAHEAGPREPRPVALRRRGVGDRAAAG